MMSSIFYYVLGNIDFNITQYYLSNLQMQHSGFVSINPLVVLQDFAFTSTGMPVIVYEVMNNYSKKE
jgi:hypothetical protein